MDTVPGGVRARRERRLQTCPGIRVRRSTTVAVRAAVDIGGTFTDLVLFDDATGALGWGKALSTPEDLIGGVLAALDGAGVEPAGLDAVIHGSDGRRQRPDRAGRGAHRAGDHPRLPRRLRHRPDQPPRLVQPRLHQAHPAAAPGAALRARRAARRRGRACSRRSTRPERRRWPTAWRPWASRPWRWCCCTPTATPRTSGAPGRSCASGCPGAYVTAVPPDQSREYREYERTSTTVANAFVGPRSAATSAAGTSG